MKKNIMCIVFVFSVLCLNAQQQNQNSYTSYEANRVIDSLEQRLNRLAYRYDVLKKENQQANYSAIENEMRLLKEKKIYWQNVLISIEAAKNTAKGSPSVSSNQIYTISKKDFDALPQKKKDQILQNPTQYKIIYP